MNNLFKTFATDGDIEKNGVWLNFGPVSDEPGAPDMKIRIARAGGSNTTYQKRQEALLKPYRHQLQHGLLSEEVSKRIMHQIYAEAVVLGWENIPNAEGEFMEFTKENAMWLFDTLPELFKAVKKNADETELFRQHLREEDAKN